MQNLILRQAQPEDAVRIIAYMQTLAAEPNIGIGLSEGEFTQTEEQEARFIEDLAQSGNSLFLVAEADGKLIGLLTLQGGKRRSDRHAAYLGITVANGCRNQGVGKALMQAAMEWARASGTLKRIGLRVYTDNQPAIHLYENFGFKVEGQNKLALYRDNRFHDVLLMALLLEEVPG